MYVSGSSAFYKTTAARRRRVRLEITQSMYTVYIHIAATRTFATQHTRPIRLRDKCNDSFNTYVITANNIIRKVPKRPNHLSDAMMNVSSAECSPHHVAGFC